MKFFALFSFLLFFQTAWAEFKVPPLTGPVMDTVGVMDPSDAQNLAQLLYDYNKSGRAQIQVLILPNLQGEEIESASIKITDQWKLGDKKKDNGVLFLIAVQEHRLRIEVGQGLEGTLPDITANHIIGDDVTPLFRAGHMSAGIVQGVYGIIRAVDKEYADQKLPAAPAYNEDADSNTSHSKGGLGTILILFLVLIFLSRIFRGGGGGGGGFLLGAVLGSMGGGGGRDGGGWSGGGGGFSGGGASGSW